MKGFLKLSFVLLFSIAVIAKAQAQAKNAIGLGGAWNVSRAGSSGYGFLLQSEIKASSVISITPSIGIETPYLAYAGLGGRYYFSPEFYTGAGCLLHVGGDDARGTGLGGTAGFGFILASTKRSVFDLNFHTDLMSIDYKTSLLAGIRLTYNFSFSKLAE